MTLRHLPRIRTDRDIETIADAWSRGGEGSISVLAGKCFRHAIARNIYFSSELDDEDACRATEQFLDSTARPAGETNMWNARDLTGKARECFFPVLLEDANLPASIADEIWKGAVRWTAATVTLRPLEPDMADAMLMAAAEEGGETLRVLIYSLYRGNINLFHALLGFHIDCPSSIISHLTQMNDAALPHVAALAGKAAGLEPADISFLLDAHEIAGNTSLETSNETERMLLFEIMLRKACANYAGADYTGFFTDFTCADPFPYRTFEPAYGRNAEILPFPGRARQKS